MAAMLNRPATMNTFCETQSLGGHVSALAWFDKGIKSIKANRIMASCYHVQTKEHSINRPDQMLGCWESQ